MNILRNGLLRMAHLVDSVYDLRKTQANKEEVKSINSALKSVVLSPSESCNRKCSFCPHGNGFEYADRFMTVKTARRVAFGLGHMDFRGRIGLSGNGEPLLNDNILDIVSTIRENSHPQVEIELVTNGDFLGVSFAKELKLAGVSRFLVSLHDGEHQVAELENTFKSAEISEYLLRNHWDEKNITMTNRCGLVRGCKKTPSGKCYFPFYKMEIRWNGELGLCSQDWKGEFGDNGNLEDYSMSYLWNSQALNDCRKRLINGDRSAPPCDKCDADGTMHGENSFNFIKEKLNEHIRKS